MSGKTLLVVDDEPANLDLLQLVVEETGLAVSLIRAANGEEAVTRAQQYGPDLVLMDLKMPGTDGWEATRRLKADPQTAHIPVIAVTAQAMPGDLESALAAGCDGYVTKPIDIRAIVALLRERLA